MKTQHTPGPWRVKKDQFNIPNQIHSDNKIVCFSTDVFSMKDDPNLLEREANAMLISCAPDLAEKLIEVKRELFKIQGGDNGEFAHLIVGINTALAKAGVNYII
jgi:hypothetical protein